MALSVVAVFVFGLGIVIGNAGFRIDSGALGNVFGVTPHQWGILLSGLIGSVAGGLVAIWVLRKTLEKQDLNHRKQLNQTQKLHSEQLEAQRSEAARERSHATAAAILSALWLLNRASKISHEEMREQIDAAILGAHTLRLEGEHAALSQQLMHMIGELDLAPEIVVGNEPARMELLKITGAVSGAIVTWFHATVPLARELALASIKQSEEAIAKLLSSEG